MKITEESRLKAQRALPLLRYATGMTTAKFAEHLGFTRQMLNNLESFTNVMTPSTYIVLRFVIDDIIEANDMHSEILKMLLQVFIDDSDNYTEEDRNRAELIGRLLASSCRLTLFDLNRIMTELYNTKEFAELIKKASKNYVIKQWYKKGE